MHKERICAFRSVYGLNGPASAGPTVSILLADGDRIPLCVRCITGPRGFITDGIKFYTLLSSNKILILVQSAYFH